MTRADALRELLAKVEAGEWFPGLAQRAIGGVQTYNYAREAFLGSLDAAKALHEAVLPGWICRVQMQSDFDDPENATRVVCVGWCSILSNGRLSDENVEVVGVSLDPARAWLIAVLKALISVESPDE